jgi:CRISPR/Cas system CSM-associated protein Csm2 small subunit
MKFGENTQYIPAGTKDDQQAMRKFVKSCRELGLNFVETSNTLHKEMHHLEELSKHSLDGIFWPGKPEKSHLSEKMVRKILLRHLKSVERSMLTIIAQLEELVEENKRDQKTVRAIDAVVETAIDKISDDDHNDIRTHDKVNKYYDAA